MSLNKSASVIGLGAVAFPLLVSAACGCGSRQTGDVYVMTNNANSNTIAAFYVNNSGTLVSTSRAEGTKGKGSGSSTNPLNSQGALAVSRDGKWLIALNAGSNEISLFSTSNRKLAFTSKIGSMGQFPASVATNGNRVFVLNKRGMTPGIYGFSFNKKGELTAIDKEKAVRQLAQSANYSQIGISPNGKWLVVCNESTNMLIAYALNGDTIAKDSLTLETSGSGPSAFAFDKRNNLIVAESSSGTVSSYSLSNDGIKVITAALPIGQTRPRWIACNGDYAYTSAIDSGIFPTIRVNNDGQLTLISNYSAGSSSVTELAINSDGTHLYTFSPKSNTISRFRIEADGKLVLTESIPDYFGPYAQGIAAN